MIYLYLKTHNTTGLQYLGQTSKPDPYSYKGSGKHWKSHIKKHGYDVTTTILYETPFKEEIEELGLYFSDLWNIVESKEFANLCIEDGYSTTGYKLSEEHKQKISTHGRKHSEHTKRKIGDAHRGKILSEETKRKMSESLKGTTLSEERILKMSGRTLSDETKRKMSESAKNRRKV